MQWLERSSQDAEVDLVLFPGDAVWKKVTQAGEEARVFLLEFPATKQHYFFWMQEPKEEKDAEVSTRLLSSLSVSLEVLQHFLQLFLLYCSLRSP